MDTVGASAELLDDVAGDLCDLRHQRGLDEVDIRHIKAAVNGWNDLANDIRAERLQPFLRPGVSLDAVKEILSVDMFDGLATSKQEFAWAKRNMPYIEPRVVNVGGKDEVISFNVASLLQRMLVHNAGFRKTCEDRSREWKKGEQWQVTPDTDNVLDDFDKGQGGRSAFPRGVDAACHRGGEARPPRAIALQLRRHRSGTHTLAPDCLMQPLRAC